MRFTQISGESAHSAIKAGNTIYFGYGRKMYTAKGDKKFDLFDEYIIRFCSKFGTVPKFYQGHKIRPIKEIQIGSEDDRILNEFLKIYQASSPWKAWIETIPYGKRLWTTIMVYDGHSQYPLLNEETQRLVLQERFKEALRKIA